MKSVTSDHFLDAFQKYYSDKMFPSEINKVKAKFFENTGLTSLSGTTFTPVCLILAQAMENILVGYSGGDYIDKSYLNEAIAFHLGNFGNEEVIVDRYKKLVTTVYTLQQESPFAASVISNL